MRGPTHGAVGMAFLIRRDGRTHRDALFSNAFAHPPRRRSMGSVRRGRAVPGRTAASSSDTGISPGRPRRRHRASNASNRTSTNHVGAAGDWLAECPPRIHGFQYTRQRFAAWIPSSNLAKQTVPSWIVDVLQPGSCPWQHLGRPCVPTNRPEKSHDAAAGPVWAGCRAATCGCRKMTTRHAPKVCAVREGTAVGTLPTARCEGRARRPSGHVGGQATEATAEGREGRFTGDCAGRRNDR
jgi:hypothetical protein